MLALFEEARLINHAHGLRIPEMLDHRGVHRVAEGISIPYRPSPQMLHPVRGGFAADFRELPALFPLYGAEQTTDICPSAPPDFAPRKLGPSPSFHFGLPQPPGAHCLEVHVS